MPYDWIEDNTTDSTKGLCPYCGEQHGAKRNVYEDEIEDLVTQCQRCGKRFHWRAKKKFVLSTAKDCDLNRDSIINEKVKEIKEIYDDPESQQREIKKIWREDVHQYEFDEEGTKRICTICGMIQIKKWV